MHEQLQASGLSLQKIKDLSKTERQQLKNLVQKTQESQDSLIQYIPLMSEFIVAYEAALNAKGKQPQLGLLNAGSAVTLDKINKIDQSAEENETSHSNINETASKELLERFSTILNTLVVSEKHKTDIGKIKLSLKNKISNQVLMTKCLNVFDLIIEDLKNERSSAKIFLSTLSETLASVQASVSSTIASSAESNAINDKINKELKEKINDMSLGINDASSLNDMKVDVNDKLLGIAKTLEKKTLFEEKQTADIREKIK